MRHRDSELPRRPRSYDIRWRPVRMGRRSGFVELQPLRGGSFFAAGPLANHADKLSDGSATVASWAHDLCPDDEFHARQESQDR
jgi:hypothetical protein